MVKIIPHLRLILRDTPYHVGTRLSKFLGGSFLEIQRFKWLILNEHTLEPLYDIPAQNDINIYEGPGGGKGRFAVLQMCTVYKSNFEGRRAQFTFKAPTSSRCKINLTSSRACL
jgi:hypothetical protein